MDIDSIDTLFKRIIKMPYDKKQKLKIKKHVNEVNILQKKSVLRIFLNHDEKLIIFNNYYLGVFFPNIPHNMSSLGK